MIICKPKFNTYISLSFILIVLISGLIYILNHFATQRTFGLFFYLIASVLLTMVIILLLVKMMAAYKFVIAGKDKITLRLPLRGFTKIYDLNQVMVWEEEKLISNKREFKQLTVAFDDHQSISLSNHEHLNYDDFSKYLYKKLPKKQVSVLQKSKTSQKKSR
jgi:hypothetical protein